MIKNLLYFFLLLVFAACEKGTDQSGANWNSEAELYQHNANKISISTGISGTVIQREGNCMPIIEEGECRWFPITNTVQIYAYATTNNVYGQGPFFDSVDVEMLMEVSPDAEGFFQFPLDTGVYSVFILEKGKYYANSYNGQGGVNSITIYSDSVSRLNMVLDYAVY
jgi:hypothetical protein